MLFKNKILCLILLMSLCLGNHIAFADHGQVIKTLQSSAIKHAGLTKREKWLASNKACGGFRRAHTSRKVVALTFDDGPSKYTKDVLKVLKENNIHATFFFLGKNIEKYPSIVKKTYLDGNIIANHTYSHVYLPNLSGEKIEAELTKTNKLVHDLIEVYPALFRPPYGSCSDKSRRIARNLGFNTIMWSSTVDDYHYECTTPVKIACEILELVHPGAIICLHDGGGNREKTVEALKIIIFILKNEGYEFLTIPELLDIPAYLDPLNDEDPDNLR